MKLIGHLTAKLRFLALLSTLWSGLACIAWSHEVVPTIADLRVTDGVLELDLQLTLESLLAGIDLDALQDTDDAPQAERYDALRAQPPQELAAMATQLLPGWSDLVQAQGGPLQLSLQAATTEDEPNIELARVSRVTLSAVLPDGAPAVRIAWPRGQGELVVRQQGVDEPFTGLIRGGETSAPIPLAGGGAQTGWQSFWSYIPVGFDHILPKGLDHILFVLGLFFLSTRLGPLLWQVSAFTLAHTVTLALGALGWVQVPGSIVEPLIAASIVYVAVENIRAQDLSRWRPLVIFGFGLLHGLGFASVLGEFGLPQGQFIPALIGFNVGVELGQLTVIALAFLAVGWFWRKEWYRRAIAIPASVVIAAIGAYWVIERTLL